MAKIFEQLGIKRPKKSAFDLSREQKLSFDMGNLIPTFLEEVIPGDDYKVKTETMLRFAPMLAPVMHRVDVYLHYFFVPNRILWNSWEDFITGGQDGNQSPTFPTYTISDTVRNSKLSDYLGIPQTNTANNNFTISQLPYRAYQLIWNEYYRDENLDTPIDIHTGTETQMTTLRKRAWEKDYFTSALPWTQRGTEVGIPIDIEYKTVSSLLKGDGGNPSANQTLQTGGTGLTNQLVINGVGSRVENLVNTNLDYSINELRTSSAIQRFMERQAKAGYRYIETLLSQFGVHSDDARLQRPEYLGGGKQPVVISEVLNTTGTTEAPQGDMAGHGISVGTTNSFTKSFKEHGYIIGIMSVLPKTGYQQGIHKHWRRFDKFDYAWPELANLGEQAILNHEIYFQDTFDSINYQEFGYQQRYAEYKYGQSTVHGDFRSTLDFWHLGRIFGSTPYLNANFMASDPSNRIFAVTTEDTIWCQLYHDVKARRVLPYFSNPSLR